VCIAGTPGTPINKPVNVNKTACECTIEVGDCLCVFETFPFFLIVDIKGPATDEVFVIIEEKVLPPPPGRQQGRTVGPTFASGARRYLHTCGQKIGNTIYGGSTPGVYKVFVAANSNGSPDESTKVPCGEICVLGPPGVKEPSPGSDPCYPDHGGTEVLITNCNMAQQTAMGQKLFTMKDDCTHVLELWCVDNPGEFKLVYDQSTMVHNCVFAAGRNAWDVFIDTCKGKDRFVRVQGWNQSKANSNGQYSLVEYDFDACENKLRWIRYNGVSAANRPLDDASERTGNMPPPANITPATPPYPRGPAQLCIDQHP